MSEAEILIKTTKRFTTVVFFFIVCLVGSVVIHFTLTFGGSGHASGFATPYWSPPDTARLRFAEDSALIRYGRALIEHTARYLGPKGTVRRISNGLNCNNCHLSGGTRLYAANYSAVASTYPKVRSRSGRVEGFEKRINDCLQRSLNGDTLDHDSREMKAMIAYMKWLGQDVPRGITPLGSGLLKLSWLPRMADTVRGKEAYARHCASCHGPRGEGVLLEDGVEWKYPPLWGNHSFNTAAGLYRLSKFAAFIKANMPYGTTFDNPVLSDEEAWDIAAYVNSQPRPQRHFPNDWPDLSKKPVDHPFGPYADRLTEEQHKYGPWGLITSSAP